MAMELYIREYRNEGFVSVVTEYQLCLTINDKTYKLGGPYKNYDECAKLAKDFVKESARLSLYIDFDE